MKSTARIEVHFTTGAGKEHVVVIKANSKVDAIMLRPSKPPTDSIPSELAQAQPELASIAVGDGPGVCYMIDGSLQCW
jgi:hypothetical protein